jgi:hypothetical protein
MRSALWERATDIGPRLTSRLLPILVDGLSASGRNAPSAPRPLAPDLTKDGADLGVEFSFALFQPGQGKLKNRAIEC